MKTVKFTSLVVVSAAVAVVSTGVFAVEPVFTGKAGVQYVMQGNTAGAGEQNNSVNTADGFDLSKIELKLDTGVVYAELEIAAKPADGDHNSEAVSVGLEKIYVKQGELSFGRFDGTLADDAWIVVDGTSKAQKLKTENFAVRYAVMPGLKVSLEATSSTKATTTEAAVDSEFGLAAVYSIDLGAGDVALSGGSAGDDTAYALGFSTDIGAATLAAAYSAGSADPKAGPKVDTTSMAVSIEYQASEALTLEAEYGTKDTDSKVKTGATAGTKTSTSLEGTYLKASYKVGDLTYYVKNYSKEFKNKTVLGLTASF